MSSDFVSLDHLTLVEGIGYEGIIKILEENDVDYKTEFTPYIGGRFFRTSRIRTNATKERIKELLGNARKGKFHYIICHALYEIGEEFDLTTLDGIITFDKGKLKETVYVLYDEDNN